MTRRESNIVLVILQALIILSNGTNDPSHKVYFAIESLRKPGGTFDSKEKPDQK